MTTAQNMQREIERALVCISNFWHVLVVNCLVLVSESERLTLPSNNTFHPLTSSQKTKLQSESTHIFFGLQDHFWVLFVCCMLGDNEINNASLLLVRFGYLEFESQWCWCSAGWASAWTWLANVKGWPKQTSQQEVNLSMHSHCWSQNQIEIGMWCQEGLLSGLAQSPVWKPNLL